MAHIPIRTARRRDADVIEAFQRINASVGGGEGNWSLSVFIGPDGGNPQITGAWEAVKNLPALQALIDANGALASHITANFPGMHGLSISLTRNLSENFDAVSAQVPENQAAPLITSLMKCLASGFPSYVSGDAIEKILGKDLADFYRARDESVTRIENTLAKLIEDTHGYRRGLDERFDEKRSQLVSEVAQTRAQLQQQADARTETLNEKAAALQAKEKDLDDRSARHARRALHQSLQTQLKAHTTNFALTHGTAEKRRLIHGLFTAALAFDAGLTIFTLWAEQGAPGALPTIVRILAGIVGFAVIVILYIRWADLWFRQHADEEFHLKRMSIDVDRASWVVETAMEWQHENKGPIPEQLLAELTRGLFMRPRKLLGSNTLLKTWRQPCLARPRIWRSRYRASAKRSFDVAVSSKRCRLRGRNN